MLCHSHMTHVMIPSAVLMASLLGSGHCALMCGGLVTVSARSFWQQFFYHAGRLSGYMLLGGISGWLGENALAHLPPLLSEAAAWMIALSFVALGWIGWRDGSWHLPMPGASWVSRWSAEALRRLIESPVKRRGLYSAAIGFLSLFLPCGWLYSFVLASAALADPLKAAGMMAVFWAGTLPALAVSPWILNKFIFLPRRVMPRISSVLLMMAGLLPILFRYFKFT